MGADDAVAVETRLHPDGRAAHLARHRLLAAAGWRVPDGYPSRWDADPTRTAVEMAGELRAVGPVLAPSSPARADDSPDPYR